MHSKLLIVLGLCVATSLLQPTEANDAPGLSPRRNLGWKKDQGSPQKHEQSKKRHDKGPWNYRRRLEDVKATESSDYEKGYDDYKGVKGDDYEHKGYKGHGHYDYDYKGYGYDDYGKDYGYDDYGKGYGYDDYGYGCGCDDYDYGKDYYGYGGGFGYGGGYGGGYGYYPDYSYGGGYPYGGGFYPDYPYGGGFGYGYGYGYPPYFGYESASGSDGKKESMTEPKEASTKPTEKESKTKETKKEGDAKPKDK